MNGGDSRLDGEYPSYHYVAPLYRQHEGFYQIHSSNSNENTYTNLWSGPFGGYVNAIQTFANTDSPRRILPVNVYYHFYSGERQAALEALRIVYNWVHERLHAREHAVEANVHTGSAHHLITESRADEPVHTNLELPVRPVVVAEVR